MCSGVYVHGKIQGVPVIFTADTGASRTIISTRIFNQICKHSCPELRRSSCLKGASGKPITEHGVAEFNLSLGTYNVTKDIIVAEIEDEALLGFDVLCGGEKGPADILLSKGVIILDGIEVPCFQIGGEDNARKVIAAADTLIPGKSEALLDVYVNRKEDDDYDAEASYLVEPSENFKENYNLVMASTLLDINRSPVCKVRILNPYSNEVTVKQDAVVARAERIEGIVSTLAEEERKEICDCSTIRRLNSTNVQTKTQQCLPKLYKACKDKIPSHLKELFENSTEGKAQYEKDIIGGLLLKYQNTFSKNEWDLGLTNLVEHTIDTGNAQPIRQRPRRVPLALANEEKQAIEDLVKKGVIEESSSPWSSPIVLVKKKSGELRPCVDYRKVNALVKPSGFPLPRVQDCLDAVAGSSLFSSFDLTSGYFQIPLKKEDKPKSSFVCKYGQFQMKRMPFGLNGSASTFQRCMEIALKGLNWVTCLIYIDDIIVYGATFEEHISRVDEVLDRVERAGLKLKPKKCILLQKEVIFLGHVVSQNGVRPDPTNISKILQWPTPQNPKQVRQFVATGSYYRKFVKGFATIVRPLVDLTKKGVTFKWCDKCENAFKTLKLALTGPEIMGYPLNEGGEFILDVDSSGVGIGAVLQQMQEGRERVIAYASRALNKSERNYCITEQELLAVVYFVQYFRQYLLGRKFVVRSDHQALVWLYSLKEPSGKVARWLEILAQFDFVIEYRAGAKQGHCDALSRCQNPQDCDCPDIDNSEPFKCGPCRKCQRRADTMQATINISCMDEKVVQPPGEQHHESKGADEVARALTASDDQMPGPSSDQSTKHQKGEWLTTLPPDEMALRQLKDPEIGPIYSAKLEGNKPSRVAMETASKATRHLWILWDDLFLEDGVLFKRFEKQNGTGIFKQLLVPCDLRKMVLHQMHDSKMSGHLGVKRTKEKLLQRCYWFDLKKDIQLYVARCDVCASDKMPVKKPKAPMGHLSSGAPWDTLGIDYLGPLPVSRRGNKYILVLTDHFTKYVEVMAVPNQQAEECAHRIVNDFIARWGTPLTIHSDQGATFESKLFKELCKMLNVRKTRASPRNPKGNGTTERFNSTIVKMIKAYLTEEQEDWDLYLGCLAGAYRASAHEATKLSPNLMSIGREIRLPLDLVYGQPSQHQDSNPYDVVDVLRNRMLHAHEVARRYLKVYAERSKNNYDLKGNFNVYKSGDLVWYLHETKKVGVAPKLEKRYEGPYIVKEKKSPWNYIIQKERNGVDKLVHHDKLKPYVGLDVPRWMQVCRKKMSE